MTQPPAGWHRDNNNPDLERYWDGTQWTDQTREASASFAAYSAPQQFASDVPAGDVRPWYKKKRWIGTIAAVVIIGAAGSAGGSGDDSADDSPAATSSSAPETPSPEPVADPELEQPAEPEPEPEPELTVAQEQAISSAQSYLELSGFSRKGLIRQLTSDAGEGFARKDAEFAVRYLRPDWKAEALESAESYMELSSFSKQGLIEQLSSDAGEGFTKEEATYAANKVFSR